MYEVRFSFSAAQTMYDVRSTRYDLKIPASPARRLFIRHSPVMWLCKTRRRIPAESTGCFKIPLCIRSASSRSARKYENRTKLPSAVRQIGQMR